MTKVFRNFGWLIVLAILFCSSCGDGSPTDDVSNVSNSRSPELLQNPMVWLLFIAAALGLVVFVERYLHFHRMQIKTAEFMAGLKNVLRQKNIVEAISICEATPSPTARLVREAIVERELPRVDLKELLQQTGSREAARLEHNLWILATLGQIAPLLGLLGTVMGFMTSGVVTDMQVHFAQALIPTALGLAVGIPSMTGYNYLVNETGGMILEMEETTMEAVRMISVLEPEILKEDA